MSEGAGVNGTTGGASEAVGRPGAGAILAQTMAAGSDRRGKSRDLKPLALLWPLLMAHKAELSLATLFLFASSLATLSVPAVLRLAIDHQFSDFYFLGAVSVALLLALSTALRFYYVSRLGERVVADLRAKVYAHVLRLDQSFFLEMRTGEVLSRLTTDIAIVETMSGVSLSIALRNALNLIGALALLFVISWKLTFGVLAIVPVVIVPLFLVGGRVRVLSVRAQDRLAEAVAYAGENLDQLETVQAFGRERAAGESFAVAVEAAFQASVSRLRARGAMTGLVMSLVFVGVAAVLWLGVQSVQAGEISYGVLTQFLILSVLAAGSVGQLGEVWGEIQKAAGAMERVQALLAAKPKIAAPLHPRPMPVPARGEVVFDQVSFAYPSRPDLPALAGFSLALRPGETVALVGPSGAGKSTVLRLLLRFYDPTAGRILLDGVDLRDADPAEARQRLAIVAQDASLFSGSALDNIRFGRAEATDDEVRAAARAAEAEGFIAQLPQGFDHPLGERGKSLSGGQRQRLAIARALVRDAPVLLLDEATSALDAENERLVQPALDEAMAGRTTPVIAHRLATVLRADRIVVMEDGRVVEEGRHAELKQKGGLYARLAELQFSAGI